jgi:hypothetical protein
MLSKGFKLATELLLNLYNIAKTIMKSSIIFLHKDLKLKYKH